MLRRFAFCQFELLSPSLRCTSYPSSQLTHDQRDKAVHGAHRHLGEWWAGRVAQWLLVRVHCVFFSMLQHAHIVQRNIMNVSIRFVNVS
jgi:hypothetical protein